MFVVEVQVDELYYGNFCVVKNLLKSTTPLWYVSSEIYEFYEKLHFTYSATFHTIIYNKLN